MRTKSIVLFFVVCLFLIPMLTNSCQAEEEKPYSLQIKITTSCAIPFQTLSPIVVCFELCNMGNETFSGTITLDCRTDEHSFTPTEFHISNLTKNAAYKNSLPFPTRDEGSYFFSLWIEADDFDSTIELYRDSKLLSKAIRVEATSSFFVYSFTSFLTIIGITVTILIAIPTIYFRVRKPSQDFKDVKSQVRADLRSSINHFCDVWEDRECMIPYTDLRKDLVDIIKSIRERARDELAELSEEEIGKIREVSKDFLRVANKFRNDDDSVWSGKVESEMEVICKSLKDIAKELA